MSHHSRRDERGFTLLELLVAAIAGLFVVLAAFLLSRGATRLFAAEGRVANSQLNLRLGVERLRFDLERASYMGSANAYADVDVCPKPNVVGTLGRIQGIYYQQGSAADLGAPQSIAQGIYPDTITLTGNFTTTDSYLVANAEAASGGTAITLQLNWGSTTRLLAGGAGGGLTELQAVFPPDRLVRLRNKLGSSQFLTVSSATIDANGRPVITVKSAPAYVKDDSAIAGGDRRCGGSGFCDGCELSPLQIVRYSVKSLAKDTAYAWAYPTGGVGDSTKYDLVREELDVTGAVVTGSAQIVAEYVTDLAFAFSVDTSAASTPGAAYAEPSLLALPFGDAANATWGGDTSTFNTAFRPQRIRSVRYRLTTRTRFPEADVAGPDGVGPGTMRYQLAANQFARTRTVYGEISLPNQRAIIW